MWQPRYEINSLVKYLSLSLSLSGSLSPGQISLFIRARIRENEGKSEAAEKSSKTGEKWLGCSGEKRDEGVEDAEGGAEPWGAGAARSARDGDFIAIEDGHGVDLEAA